MPLPFILGSLGAKVVLGAAASTGVAGAAKGIKGMKDAKEAKDVQRRAEYLLDEEKRNLDEIREKTAENIKKLGKIKLMVSAREINNFVSIFSRIRNVELRESIGLDELKKLNIKEDTIGDMKDVAIGATDILSGGISGVGAGALLGWGAYGGVKALGVASTGAAINGLSGVAATNATLAWLGGGALAAGGGGMALGAAVLGGIVAGPALLVSGGIFGAKAKESLNDAYSNLAEARKIVEELKTAEVELNVIGKKARQLDNMLRKLANQFKYTIMKMKELTNRKTDWNRYSDQEKKLVAISVKYAQVIKGIIDIPLLTEEGVLTSEVKEVVNNKQTKDLSNRVLRTEF